MADDQKIKDAAKAEIESAMNKAFEKMGAPGEQLLSQSDEKSEELGYVDPIQDPYGKAIKYLEKHNIMQLFQTLTASIVYTKPEDPLKCMMKEIQQMKNQK